MDRRRELVEHPFGSIKKWMGQGGFVIRRLSNVRGEFSLTALACNIRRAINLVGIPALASWPRPASRSPICVKGGSGACARILGYLRGANYRMHELRSIPIESRGRASPTG